MYVAIHELKAQLSRCVAQASAGEVIVITSHNKPVARLTGVPAAAPAGLQAMIASGAASWSGRKPVLGAPVRLTTGGTSLSDMVIEDRG
jgi:prevent-host-death family protein